MAKKRIMTVLGTRPEIIRLSQVIKRLDKDYDHVLVHTGQNYDYELNQIFFMELGLRKPDYYLDCVGKNLGETIGNVISKSYDLMLQTKPDALLILGDTNSALCAISAKRLHIPIFHMEAGNRCWDWNVPEMTNRVMIDHISDINMPYTEYARQNLLDEGFDPRTIIKTGSPMYEVIDAHREEIDKSDILERLGLKDKGYLVISAHREENIDIDDKFDRLFPSLNKVVDELGMPALFSIHPRTRRKLDDRGFRLSPLIIEHKPLGFIDYVHLQQHAYCVLSDSGTLTEESAIIGFPAVLIRTSTERQEGLLAGSIELGGVDFQTIISSTYDSTADPKRTCSNKHIVSDYKVAHVSSSVTKILESYFEVGDCPNLF